MHHYLKNILTLLVVSSLTFSPLCALAQTEYSLRFVEVSVSGTQSSEWVEIRNDGLPLNLEGVRFVEGGSSHGLKSSTGTWEIPTGGTAIIVNDEDAFRKKYPTLPPTCIILDSNWTTLVGRGGFELKRGDEVLARGDQPILAKGQHVWWGSDGWAFSTTENPCEWPHRIPPPPPPRKLEDLMGLKISELYPYPSSNSSPPEEEWIEIFNGGPRVFLDGVWMRDASGTQKNLTGNVLESGNYLLLRGKEIGFSLNNGGDRITLGVGDNENEEIIDEVEYGDAERAHSYARESTGGWRWTVTSTPGSENRFVLMNVPPRPKLKTSAKLLMINEEIVLDGSGSTDGDNDELRYRWDMGDGRKTEGSIVRHSYKQAGIFTVTLFVSDGKEEKSISQKITVRGLTENKNVISQSQKKAHQSWPTFDEIFPKVKLPKPPQRKEEKKEDVIKVQLVVMPGILAPLTVLVRVMEGDDAGFVKVVRLRKGSLPALHLGSVWEIPVNRKQWELDEWRVSSNRGWKLVGSEKIEIPLPISIEDAAAYSGQHVLLEGVYIKRKSQHWLDDGTGEINLNGKITEISDGMKIKVPVWIQWKSGNLVAHLSRQKIDYVVENKKVMEKEVQKDEIKNDVKRRWWEWF